MSVEPDVSCRKQRDLFGSVGKIKEEDRVEVVKPQDQYPAFMSKKCAFVKFS